MTEHRSASRNSKEGVGSRRGERLKANRKEGESQNGRKIISDGLLPLFLSLPWSLLLPALLCAPHSPPGGTDGAAPETWLGHSLLAFPLLDQGWVRGTGSVGLRSQFSPRVSSALMPRSLIKPFLQPPWPGPGLIGLRSKLTPDSWALSAQEAMAFIHPPDSRVEISGD